MKKQFKGNQSGIIYTLVDIDVERGRVWLESEHGTVEQFTLGFVKENYTSYEALNVEDVYYHVESGALYWLMKTLDDSVKMIGEKMDSVGTRYTFMMTDAQINNEFIIIEHDKVEESVKFGVKKYYRNGVNQLVYKYQSQIGEYVASNPRECRAVGVLLGV